MNKSKFFTRRIIKKILKRSLVIGLAFFIYWPLASVYLICAIYDVLRQKTHDKKFVFYQYFLVNGMLSFIFSPINLLIDIISLPFYNKQVYNLTDLPKAHRAEINKIIDNCPREYLTQAIDNLALTQGRSMLLYKWYGFNVDNQYSVPLFHEKFSKILTIGVSSFKPHTSTTKHFGWLRAGIRVLINIDDSLDDGAYIEVNDKKHVWSRDGQLFIFDDTVLHISHNLTDKTRNCLFIDILRPSYLDFGLKAIIKSLGWLSNKLPYISTSSKWKIIK